MGSSQTRARTRVPCIGRQILNHCATREALTQCLDSAFLSLGSFLAQPLPVKLFIKTSGLHHQQAQKEDVFIFLHTTSSTKALELNFFGCDWDVCLSLNQSVWPGSEVLCTLMVLWVGKSGPSRPNVLRNTYLDGQHSTQIQKEMSIKPDGFLDVNMTVSTLRNFEVFEGIYENARLPAIRCIPRAKREGEEYLGIFQLG